MPMLLVHSFALLDSTMAVPSWLFSRSSCMIPTSTTSETGMLKGKSRQTLRFGTEMLSVIAYTSRSFSVGAAIWL